jgi:hypothetical protein
MLPRKTISMFSLPGIKTLNYEQNLVGRKIVMVCLSAIHWPVIEPHVPKIVATVDRAMPGSFTRVEGGRFTRGGRKPNAPTLD